MIDVGKIIYLLDIKTQAIVPCMVVEQVKTITLSGEVVHHIVQVPSGQKKIKLENYKNPWFETLDDARNHLLEMATSLIDKSITAASDLSQEAFGDIAQENLVESQEELTAIPSALGEQAESLMVDLGDGQKAKVLLPDGF